MPSKKSNSIRICTYNISSHHADTDEISFSEEARNCVNWLLASLASGLFKDDPHIDDYKRSLHIRTIALRSDQVRAIETIVARDPRFQSRSHFMRVALMRYFGMTSRLTAGAEHYKTPIPSPSVVEEDGIIYLTKEGRALRLKQKVKA